MKVCPVQIDKRLVEYLKELIVPAKVTPGVDRDSLMYNAGKLSVIELLENEQRKQTGKQL